MHTKSFFITGNDTDVGKTVIAAWISTHLPHITYYKPIQSGTPDTDTFKQLTSSCCTIQSPNYTFKEAIAPHRAAQKSGITIDMQEIKSVPSFNTLVEGAGGLLSPINNQHTVLDLIQHVKLPAIVVAKDRLGAINHTALTVQKLQQSGITVLGVVINQANEGYITAEDVERYAHTQTIATLPQLPHLNFYALKNIPLPAQLISSIKINES